MSEVAAVSALIGAIYDAALERWRWPSVLEKICAHVGGYCANIFILDGLIKKSDLIYTWGEDPLYWDAFRTTYGKINPAFPTMLLFDAGKVLVSNDVVPDPQLRATRFYKEWLQPQGFVDCIGAVLEKSATSCAALAVFRHERSGIFDEAAVRRMDLLVPHIQRAVLIGKAIDLKSRAAESFADTIDALTDSVYLLDAEGRMLHANRSGIKLLGEGDPLRGLGGRLRARSQAADMVLAEVLAASARGDHVAVAAKGNAISLATKDGQHYVAHVLPLTFGARRHGESAHSAVAALFVHEATFHIASQPEAIAKAYGLTPREIGVLFAAMEVGGVPEVATILGLSRATVKTHMLNLFAKTGAKRQADLVKLVAAFSSPVAQRASAAAQPTR
jgi:DNA-binding CsgD family transcriptional regulator/PAS domain-containing protein